MSQVESNPFQAPIQPSVEASAQAPNKEGLDFIVIAKKWERYRLIYNGILILETIVLGGLCVLLVGFASLIELAVVAVIGALTVNFFFLLGPALDGYCQWIFDSRSKAFGLIILVLGSLFTTALAAVTIAGLAAGAGMP